MRCRRRSITPTRSPTMGEPPALPLARPAGSLQRGQARCSELPPSPGSKGGGDLRSCGGELRPCSGGGVGGNLGSCDGNEENKVINRRLPDSPTIYFFLWIFKTKKIIYKSRGYWRKNGRTGAARAHGLGSRYRRCVGWARGLNCYLDPRYHIYMGSLSSPSHAN